MDFVFVSNFDIRISDFVCSAQRPLKELTMDVEKIVESIEPLDKVCLKKAQERLDRLAIPRGSLGRLMDLGKQYAAARRNPMPKISKKKDIYLCR